MNRISAPPAEIKSHKIADIEVLRAVAILYVILHHANGNLFKKGQFLGDFFQGYFGGWVGVDLFFAISGFVIARTLIPVLSQSSDGQKFRRETLRFWGKRALRLLPSAWLWLFIILALVVGFNESGVFGDLQSNLWATLAGMFNFANVRFADAFFQYPYGASFVYWSLSLEEQFYILLPILFFLTRRYMWVVLLVLVLWKLPQMRGIWGMAFRADAISLGVLVALLSQHPIYARMQFNERGWLRLAAVTAMLISLVLMPLIGAQDQVRFTWQIGILAFLSALSVLLASCNSNLLAGFPGAGIALWIGARSYAMYLIHIPAFFLLREMAYRWDYNLGSSPLLVFIVALGLIFILAELNFRFIETPVRGISQRLFS